jgi:hypothetical protein
MKAKNGIYNQIQEAIGKENIKIPNMTAEIMCNWLKSLNKTESSPRKKVIQIGVFGIQHFCNNIGIQEFINFLEGVILLTSKEGKDYLKSLNIDLSKCEIKVQ